MAQFGLGLQLMAYGLIGVFMVLIVFFGMIKALIKLFPARDDEEPKVS